MALNVNFDQHSSASTSIVIDGIRTVYLAADLYPNSSSQSSTIRCTIMNEELYKANLNECREQITAFFSKVYAIQDTKYQEAE